MAVTQAMADAGFSVCMFSNLYPPVVSGSATQSSTLARELARRGCRIAVVTARIDASPEHEQVDGVDVYRLPAWHLPKLPIALNFPWLSVTFTPGNQKRIRNILERHRPDVLHLHNHMFDLAFSAVLAAKRFDKPLATTMHTVIKHAVPFYNLLLYPADRLFLRHLVIRHADCLICPDRNIEDYVLEAFGRAPTALVPYGIDLPPVAPQKVQAIIARHNLQGRRVILSLGHVHEIRNRKDLIEALPMILQAIPNAVLLVVGALSTEMPATLTRKLGVEHAVIFAGAVPHEEIGAYLAVADLEAHWLNQGDPGSTSLGVASLEAMAFGKVVLAAANPDTYGQGLLKSSENIVIVEPGKPRQLAQTIIALLSDDALRQTIGQAAAQTIREHFSWESVCARTVDVYQRITRKA